MRKGSKMTIEQKERLSIAHLGIPSPRKGVGAIQKECKQCLVKFEVPKSRNYRIFCSYLCSSIAKKGTVSWNKGLKGFGAGIKKPWFKELVTGEKNYNWKGDSVKYRALHNWVERNLGKPNICTDCFIFGEGHQMHWANISKEYKREISDWKRLCPSCHGKFDKKTLEVKEMAY